MLKKYLSSLGLTLTGEIKKNETDFIVTERIKFFSEGRTKNYTYIQLKIVGWEKNKLIFVLCSKLRISPRRISYCGLKDKKSQTIQTFCFKDLLDEQIEKIKKIKNIEIMHIEKKSNK